MYAGRSCLRRGIVLLQCVGCIDTFFKVLLLQSCVKLLQACQQRRTLARDTNWALSFVATCPMLTASRAQQVGSETSRL